MINYHSHILNLGDDYLKISTDYNIQFENSEETYLIEPPPKLTEFISKRFDSSNFDFYKIYFKSIEINKVTRVTDYKGICGLLSLPIGILSGSCISTTQKTYFGIDITPYAILSSKCSFIICCPKSSCITSQTIFSLIKELSVESFGSLDTLSRDIYRKNPNWYIIYWDVKNMIEISIHGSINNIFSHEDLSTLKNFAIE